MDERMPDGFPTFDRCGYPSEATLRYIASICDPEMAITAITDAWNVTYGSMWRPAPGVITLSTGGWSGCEDVWRAFQESPARCLSKVLSLEGGMHIVAYTQEGKEKMRELEEMIANWATTEAKPSDDE